MSYQNRIKLMSGFLLRWSGLPYFLREVVLKNKNTIICYHKPSPELLREHLTYLIKRYNIIALDTLVDAMIKRTWAKMPEKSLVITFDDGLKESYDLWAVIRDFRVPVTIYLPSHIVNTNRKYWFLAGASDVQKLKTLPNRDRLSILKEKTGFEQDKEYGEAQSLNIDQILEMSEYVDFQSHSRFHPVLSTCHDKECWDEIKESKQSLEKALERQIKHFAYPNGNYGRREMGFLKQIGYRSGASMDMGWNGQYSNPYCLKRFGISDTASIDELIGEISGVFGFLRRMWELMMGEG